MGEHPSEPAGVGEVGVASLGGHVVAIVNASAGTASSCNEAADRLSGIVESRGGRCTILRTGDMGGMLPVLEKAREQEADAFVGIGGDGTVAATATLAFEKNVPMAIGSAGTMNLVARDLGLPLDVLDAISGLERPVVRRIDVATVNGLVFLHSCLLGVIPKLGRLRERVRESESPKQAARWAALGAQTLGRAPDLTLTLRSGDQVQRVRTGALIVTNNELAHDNWLSHERAQLDAGRLGVYASTHKGLIGRLTMLGTLAFGQLRGDPQMLAGVCTSLSVDASAGELEVSNDGEVFKLKTPIRFEIHPRALAVLVPAPAEGEAVA